MVRFKSENNKRRRGEMVSSYLLEYFKVGTACKGLVHCVFFGITEVSDSTRVYCDASSETNVRGLSNYVNA